MCGQIVMVYACGHERAPEKPQQCEEYLKYLNPLPWYKTVKIFGNRQVVPPPWPCEGAVHQYYKSNPNRCEACNERVLREQRHGKGEQGAATGRKDADRPQIDRFGQLEIKRYLAGLSGAACAPGQSQPLSPASSKADEGYYTGSSGPDAWEWHVRRERELRGLSETPLQRTPSEVSHRRRDHPETPKTPIQRRPAVRRTPTDEDRRRDRRSGVLLSRSGRQDAVNGLHTPPTNDQPPLDRSGSAHVKWTDNTKEYAELSKAQQEWASQLATPTSRPPPTASGKVTPLMPEPLRIVKKSPVDGEPSPRRLSFDPIPRPTFASPCGDRGRPNVREAGQPKRTDGWI